MCACAKPTLYELEVGAIDIRLVRVCDRRRLEVGALDDAEVRRPRQQSLEVVHRPIEVRLQHRSDSVVAGVAQPLVQTQRRVDVLRLLHVDAKERPKLAGALDQSCDVRVCSLLVEGQAEVRELESDVRLQLLRNEALDDLLVFGGDRGRALGVRYRLAEERRVRIQARVVQLAQDGDARLERLACDEASGTHAPAVPLHEMLEARALCRRQDGGARERRDCCPEVGQAVPRLHRCNVSSGKDPVASPRGVRTGRPSAGARRSRARPDRP